MRDLFGEIYNSIRNNKLRTALTGFAVSWGIFLLICLLGTGNGITNSLLSNSSQFVQNSIQVYGGRTSMPANGYRDGRWIQLDDGDVRLTKDYSDKVEKVATVTNGTMGTIVMGDKTVSAYMMGVTAEYSEIQKVSLKEGRFINPLDEKDAAKVAVLSTTHLKDLGDDVIGRWITIAGVVFRVVGVYHGDENDFQSNLYIPYSTYKGIFDPSDKISSIIMTFRGVNNIKESDEFEGGYSRSLKTRHQADPDDPSAIWIWNRFSQNVQMTQAQNILRIALWIIGILTLISGIVGVSNIMLITVKERTHEFGIRKAIGARPGSILSLIIAESVTITALFGYIGMFLGMIACEVLDKTAGANAVDIGFTQIRMLENPTVGLDTALAATLLLVVAGTIAGLAPARKAAKVKPIEALRAE